MTDADPKLSERLFSIAARLDSCHKVAGCLADTDCNQQSDQQSIVLFLLETQLGHLTEELMDIAEGNEIRALDRMDVLHE